ncbi:MAG: hypothetical protein H6573_36225 [Lewinellaceae bacterium]|nr:hypothetical protein [Lewinellaceae bacterium]
MKMNNLTIPEHISERFKIVLKNAKNILEDRSYCYYNFDEDLHRSNNKFIDLLCKMTDGLLEYKGFKIKESNRDGSIIELTLMVNIHNRRELTYEFMNYGRNLHMNGIAKALNEALYDNGYRGEKYFCDVSLDVSYRGVAFMEFSKEKQLVEAANLFRGFSKNEPHGYEYYYEKLDAYNEK